jgi:hypothetical protein
VDILVNYQLQKSILSYADRNFTQLSGFTFICTSDPGFLAIDYYQWSLRLIKYDQNWNNKSIVSRSYTETQFIISVKNSNSYELFLTSSSGVYKYNSNLTLIAHYHKYITYKGIYYNKTGD